MPNREKGMEKRIAGAIDKIPRPKVIPITAGGSGILSFFQKYRTKAIAGITAAGIVKNKAFIE
jgi:hypothetical protein